MAYNGSGTFNITTAGQPVVTGTVISSTAFNALTADLATGLSTAITKDGQTTTTSRILFAQGISSTLVTDATSATTGSIITAGGISTQKALWVGTTTTLAGALTYGGVTLSNSVTGTGSMVLSAGPTLTGTAAGQTNNAASETAWTVLNNSASNGAFAILRGSNGTSSVDFGMTGTGYAGVGAFIANQAYVRCDAANGFGIYATTGPIKFVGSGFSEVSRFGSDGSLLVGTTTNSGAGGIKATLIKINNNQTVVNTVQNCITNSNSDNANLLELQTGQYQKVGLFMVNSGAGAGNQVEHIYFQYGAGTTAGKITSVGTTTTYASASDERLKDWSVEQRNYRGAIQDLWVGDYNWKASGTKGFGVRAQQAYVTLGGMGIAKPQDESGTWYASSEPFGFLAIWGVKDLYKIIDELTTRLAALESK